MNKDTLPEPEKAPVTDGQLLDGVRVVDMTEALAGPMCTMFLGDMGADVVKVERRGQGDQCRAWGPPFINGEAAYFMSTNRNKRSVTLDVKTPGGREVMHRLVDRADVFVLNIPRASSMRELGLDAESCLQRNPRLIHVAISGFGHTGPSAGRPGYDILAQGMSGTMSLTGEPDQPPIRFPTPIADMTAGVFAVVGILAALLDRHRTGKGQAIDVSLLESQMAWLTTLAGSYFATGNVPPRLGNAHPNIAPYQPFETGDGFIIVAGGTERIWARLCTVLGLADSVRDDPRFATNQVRNRNRLELAALLTERFRTQSTEYWVRALNEVDIPAGPIYRMNETFADPQVLAREVIVQLEHPVAGLVQSLAFPPHMRPGGISYRLAPPTLGQHTGEVLAELGYDAGEASQLAAAGAV